MYNSIKAAIALGLMALLAACAAPEPEPVMVEPETMVMEEESMTKY